MYGGTKDDSTYLYNLAEESGIPEIKNGYYYFYDRVDGEYFKDKNPLYIENFENGYNFFN